MHAILTTAALVLIAIPGLAADTRRVWFGTTGQGEAKGIHTATFDPQTGRLSPPELAAEVPSPGFLTLSADGRFLYATSRMPDARGRPTLGAVAAFAVEDASLRELGRRESGGGGPCFVALDATGRTLMVANYGGGSVASFPVKPDGSLGPLKSLGQHDGSSVNPRRQKAPHAHSIYPGPDNRFAYAPDLGIDRVVIYALDPAQATLTRAGAANTPPGSGPRHMKFGRDGKQAYVLGELDLTVIVYDRDAETGGLAEKQVLGVLPADADGGDMTCSEILVSRDGRFVYTANRDVGGRGRDSLSVFAVGNEGRLKRIQTVPAEVSIPRNIQLSPDGRWLLVAGQESGGVPVFRIGDDGQLAFSNHRAELPGAMCIVFEPVKMLKEVPEKPGVPSFEEWVEAGKPLPQDRVWIGGTPWFDETKGERRSAREVYDMIYGQQTAGGAKPQADGRFPAHWGDPPRVQTRDLRPLPGGYGRGSSTLARWITENMEKDARKAAGGDAAPADG